MDMLDLQLLIDERAIVRGLGLFARTLDQKHWDELSDVFGTDLTFNYGEDREQAGIDALRAQIRQYSRCLRTGFRSSPAA